GDLRGDDVADRHAAGAEDVLHHVQALDDLGAALADDLAALARHQFGERVGVALDELGEVIEQLGAVDAAGAAPGGVGVAGGGGGGAGVGGRGAGEDADDLVLAGGAAALEAAVGRRQPAAGDQVAAGDGGGRGWTHGATSLDQRRDTAPTRSGTGGD